MNDQERIQLARDLIAQAQTQVDQCTAEIKEMRSKLLQIKLEDSRKHAAFQAARDEHGKDGKG